MPVGSVHASSNDDSHFLEYSKVKLRFEGLYTDEEPMHASYDWRQHHPGSTLFYDIGVLLSLVYIHTYSMGDSQFELASLCLAASICLYWNPEPPPI